MQSPIIIVIKNLHVQGMAIYPFILLRDKALQADAKIMNHERIHHRQQLELLIIPFYFLYLMNYLLNRLRYCNHREAYLHIVFEREAYIHDSDFEYLNKRKWFAFTKFIRKKAKMAQETNPD